MDKLYHNIHIGKFKCEIIIMYNKVTPRGFFHSHWATVCIPVYLLITYLLEFCHAFLSHGWIMGVILHSLTMPFFDLELLQLKPNDCICTFNVILTCFFIDLSKGNPSDAHVEA